MKKLLIIICIVLGAPVFMACSNDDNPVPGIDNVQNPQEEVTDQPANAPER